MFWVVILIVLAVSLFVLYQTKSAALVAIKSDAAKAVAELEKLASPAEKDLAAAVSALKKHL